jgi:hypothetical protein
VAEPDFKSNPDPHKQLRQAWKESRPPKPNKYRTAPPEQRTFNGILFDSKKEGQVYLKLLALQASGKIQNLQRQVRFTWNLYAETWDGSARVKVSSNRAYVADFRYYDVDRKEWIVMDVKPMTEPDYIAWRARTGKRMDSMEVYLAKKPIVLALYNITIVEVADG